MPPYLAASIPSTVIKDGMFPQHISVDPAGQKLSIGTEFGCTLRALPGYDEEELSLEVFTGASSPVVVSAVAPDGSRIVGGDANGNVYIWTKTSINVVMNTYSPDMKHVVIKDIQLSPDGRLAAIVGIDRFANKTGAVIQTNSGANVGHLYHQPKGMCSVAFRPITPLIVVTGGYDGTIAVNFGIPFRDGYLLEEKHRGKCFCTRWNSIGDRLLSLSDHGELLLFEYSNKEFTFETRYNLLAKNQTNEIAYAADWSPCSNYIAVITDSRYIIIRRKDGDIVLSFVLKSSPRGLCWTRSSCLVIADTGGHIQGYSIDQNRLDTIVVSSKTAFTWTGPIGSPVCSCFDQNTIILGTNLGALMFVKYTTAGIETFSTMLPSTAEHSIRFVVASDGFVMCGTSSGAIHLLAYDWFGCPGINNTRSTSVEETYETKGMAVDFLKKYELFTAVNGAVLLDAGETVAVFATKHDGNTKIHCFPFKSMSDRGLTFQPVYQNSLCGRIRSTATSGDGRLVAVALEVRKNEYDLNKLATFDKETGIYKPPQVLLTSNVIELYEICHKKSGRGEWKFLNSYTYHRQKITAIALSDDGSLLSSSDKTKLVITETFVPEDELRDNPTKGQGICPADWNRHNVSISSLAWSEDNCSFITGGMDGHCYLLNMNHKDWYEPIRHAHKGGINVAIFIYSNLVLTCGNDASIKVWEFDNPDNINAADLF